MKDTALLSSIAHSSQATRIKKFKPHPLVFAIAMAGVGLPIGVMAGPQGGVVTGGAGTISQGNNTTTINQATDRLAIDWQSFDVAADERVQYIQPDSSSVALNRILSNRGSEIHGRIDANGQVILVNPNGVIFGENAVVNAGGILASGLSIDPADFMNGDLHFQALEGTDGLVINSGLLHAATGGSVSLLGKQVKNEGLISANLGTVNLAAGTEAIVTFDDLGLVGVQVTQAVLQEEIGVDPAILNSGEITAEQGNILISGSVSGDIFSQAVNSGLDHATSVVVHEDGSFTLGGGADVVNTGTLDVSGDEAGNIVVVGENVTSSGDVKADSSSSINNAGFIEIHATDTTLITEDGTVTAQGEFAQGGDIKLLGERVGLADLAELNASGATGGGQVLVGGDFQGKNAGIRNAEYTYLGENTRIENSAIVDGDGGTTIIWADLSTQFYGNIRAVGKGTGIGGFAEVSGKENLDFAGMVDLTAQSGNFGSLLLDPRNIIIASGGSDISTEDVSPGESRFLAFNTQANNDLTFSPDTIENFLSIANLELQARADIVVNDAIVTANDAPGTLTLTAGDDIQINSEISVGLGDLIIQNRASCVNTSCLFNAANGAVDVNGDDLEEGFILVGADLTTNGGDISIGSVDGSSNPVIELIGSGVNYQITSNDGAITFRDMIVAQQAENASGLVLDAGTGDIIFAEEVGGGARATSAGSNLRGLEILNANLVTFNNDLFLGEDGLNVTANQISIGDDIFTGLDASAGAINIIGDVLLLQQATGTGDVSFNTVNDDSSNSIFIDGSLNNDNSLVRDVDFTAGASSIEITGNIGNLTPLDDFMVESASTVILGSSNIDSRDGIIDINGTFSLPNNLVGFSSLGNTFFRESTQFNVATTDFLRVGAIITAMGSSGAEIRLASNEVIIGGNSAGLGLDSGNGAIFVDFDSSLRIAGSIDSFNSSIQLNGNDNANTVTLDSDFNLLTSGLTSLNFFGGSDVLNINTDINSIDAISFTAGDGNDRFVFGDAGSYAATINAQGSGNEIVARNQANDWSISGMDSGSIATGGTNYANFTNIQSIIGGTEVDNIVFMNSGSVSGLVNGGGVAGDGIVDSVDLSAISGGVLVEIGPDISLAAPNNPDDPAEFPPTNNVHVNNVENITAADDGVTGNVAGAEDNNWLVNNLTGDFSWTIDSRNQGSLVLSDNSDNTINFNHFGVLIGNDDIDSYSVADGAGISNFVDPRGGQVFSTFSGGTFIISPDTITLDSLPFVSGVVFGGLLGDGDDVISILDAASTSDWLSNWTITGENEGSFDNGEGQNFSFSGFNTLIGGDGTDNFVFGDAGSITGSIDGDGGTNSITGRNINSTWTIDALDSGSIATTDDPVTTYLADFSNVQRLVGGTANDQFLIGANIGTVGDATADIIGGEGSDEFILQVEDLGFEINAGENTGDLDVIRGVDGSLITNAWMLDQLEGGAVTNDSDELDGFDATVSFSNIEIVQGGGEFDFNDGNGSVGGVDEFTLTADLGAGTSVRGRSGADTFNVNVSQSGDLQGGAGGDRFVLNSGVAGGVQGNNGDDIFDILDSTIDVFITAGSSGTDTINLTDTTGINTWEITGADSGRLNFVDLADPGIEFSGISTINGADDGDDATNLVGESDSFEIQASFDGIINGRGGDDSFTINPSNVTDPISAVIRGGLGVNSLTAANRANNWIIGGTDEDANTLNFIADPASGISFLDIQTFNGGTDNDTFIINDASSNYTIVGSGEVLEDTLRINYDDTATWLLNGGPNETVTSGSGGIVTFSQIEIAEGSNTQSDTFNIGSGSVATLRGRGGNDRFNVLNAGVAIALEGDANTTNGDGGFDADNGDTIELVDDSRDKNWIINDSEDSTLNANISFSEIERILGADDNDLAVGENADDQFELNIADVSSLNIDARGGFDSILYSNSENPILYSFSGGLGVSNAEALRTNGANNGADFILRLTGSSAGEDIRWTIGGVTGTDGNNDGTIQLFDADGNPVAGSSISFINFGNLEGGNANDRFTISSGSSILSVEGNFETLVPGEVNEVFYEAAGADTWRLTSAFAGNINFDDQTDPDNPTQDLLFSGIQTIQGDASSSDTLFGPDRINLWILDSENSIGLQVNESTQAERLVFSNIANLVGGAESDRFNVEQTFVGSIDGRANNDFFDLNADVTGGVSGGSGDDIFDIDFVITSVIDGQANDDDFLIATSVDQTLIGSAGDDEFFIEATGISVDINGGGNTGVNGDTVYGPSIVGFTNEWNSTGARAGNLNRVEASDPLVEVSFSDIESLQGGSERDEFNLGHNFTSVSGAGGNDFFNITSAISIILNGGDGDDEFDIDQNITGTVNGDGGNDTFDLNANVTAGVNGGAGRDLFNIGVATIDGALSGGADEDTFDIQVVTSSIDIFGGDTFSDPIDDNGTLITFINSDTVRLSTDHGANQWNITSADSGDLDEDLRFDEIENIQGADGSGAAAQDRFDFGVFGGTFGSGIGGIDARGGNDSLLVAAPGTYQISLSGDLRGIANVETIENTTASATGFTLQMTPSDTDVDAGESFTWQITGENDGQVSDDANPTDSFINFINFSVLEGNEANDNFVLNDGGSITSISGSNSGDTLAFGEINSLTTPAGDNNWAITAQFAGNIDFEINPDADSDPSNDVLVNIGFQNIQNLVGGVGEDTLTGRADQNNTWTIEIVDTNFVRTVSETGSNPTDTISFSEMETLVGLAGVDTFNIREIFDGTIRGGGENDVFNLDADVSTLVSGEGGNDIFNINAFINGQISGNNGDDDFFIQSDVARSINGAAGDDEFFVLDPVDTLFLSGGNDNDFIYLDYALPSEWTIDGLIESVVSTDESSGTAISNTISFSTIENVNGVDANVAELFNIAVLDPINENTSVVNILGRNGPDTFDVNATFDGVIQGGAGADIFNLIAQVTGGVQGGIGSDQFHIESVTVNQNIHGDDPTNAGVNGDDTLILAVDDVDATWQLDSNEAGNINANIQFLEIENIDGSDGGNDTFVFGFDGEYSGLVDARGGSFNTVDTFGDDVDVVLGQTVNGVANAQVVRGNGDASVLTITGGTSGNPTIWTISDFDGVDSGGISNGENDGTISSLADGGATNELSFIDFGVLRGDGADDQFTITNNSSIISVDGNSGVVGNTEVNTLTYEFVDQDIWRLTSISSGDINFDLGTTTQDLQFSDIQSLIGSGNDTFTASDNPNVWTLDTDLNGGNRVVSSSVATTFTGMSSLVGGSNTDTFNVNANFSGSINGGAGDSIDTFVLGAEVAGPINGGGGADVFNINALVSAVLNGQGGGDQFIFGDSGIALNINGGDDASIDSIVGRNQANTWLTDADGSGQIGLTPTAPDPLVPYADFSGIEELQGGNNSDTFNLRHSFNDVFANGGNDFINVLADITANLNGNSGSDTFDIDFDLTGTLQGGTQDDDFDLSANVSGLIDGGNGSDELNYADFSGAVIVTIGSSFQNIETLVGNNTNSTLVGDGTNGTWNITGNNDGNVGGIAFTDFNNLTGGDNNQVFDFVNGGVITGLIDGGNGTDELNYADVTDTVSLTIGTGFQSIEALVGNNTSSTLIGDGSAGTWNITGNNDGNVSGITFTDFNNLSGGDNNQVFDFVNGGIITGLIDGGDGTDELNYADVTNAVSVTIGSSFQNIETLVGNNTSSTLIGDGSASTWNITGNNDGNVSGITFTDFNNLTGGDNNQVFDFVNGGIITGLIDGGDGTDELNYADVTNAVSVTIGSSFQNIETLVGNNTNSTLIGDGSTGTWNITGNNDGNVSGIAFTDFNNLTGGDNNQVFDFVNGGVVTGLIDGGNGTDELNYADVTDAVSVTIGSSFQNIETLVGNNTNSTLVGDGTNGTWNITGNNDGNVSGIAFTDFNNLTGGDNNQVFDFVNGGVVTGLIDGGDGTDELNYADVTDTVSLTIGTGFQSIEALVGNNTSSTLIGDGSASTWNITGNNDGNVSGITFTDFNNLTGGDNNQVFDFVNGGIITGLIDGGDGTDELNYADVTNAVSVTIGSSFQNIETLVGNNTSSTLIGDGSASTWNITGNNDGNVSGITFTDFNNLTGGDNNQVFDFVNGGIITGLIDGGDGTDELNYADVTNAVSVTIGSSFQNIETLAGNNTDSTLIGDGSTGTWNITGNNDGNVSGIAFTDFNNLTGGDNNQVFDFVNGGVITGLIDGGNGTDELNYADVTDAVSVTIGTGFQSIETLVGNDVSSTLIGDGSASTWNITGDNDGNVNGITFTDFNNLNGGDNNQTFDFSGGGSIDSIDGGSGTDTIISRNAGSTWTIAGVGSNSVSTSGTNYINSFEEIERATGSGLADTFNVSTSFGFIDAGSGGDSINLNAGADLLDGLNANIGRDEITIATDITGIIDGGNGADTFTIASEEAISFDIVGGAAGVDGDTLVGSGNRTLNNWVIGGSEVSSNTLNANGRFSGIENYTGSSADDNFSLLDLTISSVIDGVGGNNTLEAQHNGTVDWIIDGENSGTVDGNDRVFSNIQNLTGGEGRDVFTFQGDRSVATITGLINGGEPANAQNPESVIDEVNLALFEDGVVLIVNGPSRQGVDFDRLSNESGFNDFGTLTTIQVENVEQATAFAGPGNSGEENNWLIADTLAALNWTSTGTNQGFYYRQQGEDDVTEVLNTRVNFNNFGNIRGGDGLDAVNDLNNQTLSGDFYSGLGISILDFSGTNGLVVVDIDENTVSVIGNEGQRDGNRTLIRIDDRLDNLLNESEVINTWLIDNNAAGNLTSSFDTEFLLSFSGITDIQGGNGTDNFSFTGSGIVSGSINGDGGTNTISAINSAINQLSFGISELVQEDSVNAGRVDILEDRLDIIDFIDISELASNGLDSTLLSGNQHSRYDWEIGDENIVSYERNSQIETLNFSGFNNLAGSESVDVFSILDVSGNDTPIGVDGFITGGGGNDELDLTALSDGTSVALSAESNTNVDLRVDGFEVISANRSSDITNTLFGANNNNTWTIGTSSQSTNAGSVDGTEFDGFANLVGGSANDSFIFDGTDSITGLIDGGQDPDAGSALDRVDLTGVNQNVSVTLDSSSDIGVLNVSRIEQIDANGASNLSNRIIASSSQANTWVIDQLNGGRIEDSNGASTQVVGFDGFANLVGGANEDQFEIDGNNSGAITGVIAGGGNSDSLSITNIFNGVVVSTDPGDISLSDVDFVVSEIETLLVTNTNEAANELRSGDGNNRWTIGAEVNGSFDEENAGNLNGMLFSGFANLIGGAGEDVFTASFDPSAANPVNSVVNGVIDGGANEEDVRDQLLLGDLPLGNNVTVSLNQNIVSDYLIRDIELISANAANDNRLISDNTETFWRISGQSQGSIVNELDFAGFNNLQGSDAMDNFTILASDGADINTDQIFMNIDGMGGNDELVAADNRVNNWTFDAVDGLNRNDDDSLGIFFSSIENYTGGTGNDNFTILSGTVTGLIDGDMGSDTLQVISSQGELINWEINNANQGRVTRNGSQVITGGFESIENLSGSEGIDNFVFTTINASLFGLIDGGESIFGGQEVIDTLDVTVFVNGVRVEVGDNPSLGLADSVNVSNIERATAAPGSDEAEALNWLAYTSGADLQWNIESLNQGWVQEVEDALVTPLVPINNTRLDFNNFGSLDSGSGASSSNIQDGDISGDFIAGLGGTSLDFSGRNGLVVITLFDNVLSVTGNGNTLLRVDENSTVLNGVNEWTIFGDNQGTLSTSGGDETTLVEFNNVNQLRGGTNDDRFVFTNTLDGGGNIVSTGQLIDGSIDGGVSGNDTVSTAAISIDMVFGVNDEVNQTVNASNEPALVDTEIALVDNRVGILDLFRVETLETNESVSNTLYSGQLLAYEWNIGQDGVADTISAGENVLTFGGVSQIIGGSGNDTFNLFSVDGLLPNIDAGSNVLSTDFDTLNVTSIDNLFTFSLNENITGDGILNIGNFERLLSNQDFSNRLIASDVENSWVIERVNEGRINSMSFNGIADIIGGTANDTFTILNAGRLSGSIDGGVNLNAVDTINLVDKVTDVRVSLNLESAGADLRIVNIDSIIANEALSNTLIANSDQPNTWTINGTNSGDLNGVLFSGFENLLGSISADEFILDGLDNITGLIDGGAIDRGNPVTDILTLVGLDSDVSVSLEETIDADINAIRINRVDANQANLNTIIARNLDQNIWRIEGTNAGSVSDVEFTGFGNLIGGSGNDIFNFNQDDAITGVIDGGSEAVGDSAIDTVNLIGLDQDIIVSLDTDLDADLNIVRIEAVNANMDRSNTLVGFGQNSFWEIQGENTGSINNEEIELELTQFDGFENLIGRNSVDRFAFTQLGRLTGALDGGDQPDGTFDSVDMSQLDQVRISIGNNDQDFRNIEEYIGNNSDSVLSADDIENTWLLTEGENRGLLNDEISFIDFNILEGGSLEDHFIVNGGGLSENGELRGGAGNDDIRLTIIEGNNGQVFFDGQTGEDSVLILGGGNLFTATYRIDAFGNQEVEYVSQNADQGTTTRYSMAYAGIETVQDDALADQLVIQSNDNQSDMINLMNSQFRVNDLIDVNYLGKENLQVSAQLNDQVFIDGPVSINNELAVIGAAVNVQNGGLIDAQSARFNGNQFVGTLDNRVALDVDNLHLAGIEGATYLADENTITIASMNDLDSLVDIVAVETINGSSNLFSDGVLNLTSNAGDIILNNQNGFTNQINLNANAIALTNNTATELGTIVASQFDVIANGNITDGEEGMLTIGGITSITAEGNVQLDNATNDFNLVNVVRALDATISDVNDLSVQGSVTNQFNATAAQSLTVAETLQAANVNLNSGDEMFVRFAINASESVSLNANGFDIDGNISVSSALDQDTISIVSGSDNTIDISSVISSRNSLGDLAGNITINGDGINLAELGDLIGQSVSLDSLGNITIDGEITASDTISSNVSAGSFIMQDDGRINASALNLDVADSILLGEFNVASISALSGSNIQLSDSVQISDTASFTAGDNFEMSQGVELVVQNSDLSISAANVANIQSITASTGNIVIGGGQQVNIDGNLIANNDLSISSENGSILQRNNIESIAGNVNLDAGQDILMDAAVSINGSQNVNLSAAGDLGISLIQNVQGNVSLVSTGGSLNDNNGVELNVSANRLEVETATGVGGNRENPIDLSVSELDLANSNGSVSVENDRTLTVNGLRSNGDIVLLVNDGDLVLFDPDAEDYDRSVPGSDALLSGGIINANYETGALVVEVNNGSITTIDDLNIRRPELVGDTMIIFANGTPPAGVIGADRRLVIFARTSGFYFGGSGVTPANAFGIPPLEGFQNNTDTPIELSDILSASNELLIELESLEEIDPAVFTEVRNYSFDNISIRMPRDQLFEDEEEADLEESEI